MGEANELCVALGSEVTYRAYKNPVGYRILLREQLFIHLG